MPTTRLRVFKSVLANVFLSISLLTTLNSASFLVSERFYLRTLFPVSALQTLSLPTSKEIYYRVALWSLVSGVVIGIGRVMVAKKNEVSSSSYSFNDIFCYVKRHAQCWFFGGISCAFSYSIFPVDVDPRGNILPGDALEAIKFMWVVGSTLTLYICTLLYEFIFPFNLTRRQQRV